MKGRASTFEWFARVPHSQKWDNVQTPGSLIVKFEETDDAVRSLYLQDYEASPIVSSKILVFWIIWIQVQCLLRDKIVLNLIKMMI